MKQIVIGLVILGGCCCSPADSFQLENLQGEPYHPPTNTEIVWAATNDLPNCLWIYKVVPQEFPKIVISNLLSICGFEWRNFTRVSDSYIPDKNLIQFTDKKEKWTRCLYIAPSLGWIEYNTDSDFKPSTNGVPSRVECEKLALDILLQLGIDRSLICNMHEHETIQGKLSRDGQKLTTNVVNRGISYSRKIDGIESQVSGCFIVDFSSQSKIKRLVLSWRNLLHYQTHFVLTQNEIMDLIKAGQTSLPSLQTHDLTGIDKARKLTITEIRIAYLDKIGHKPLDFSYPFAALTVQANLEGTNMATFFLQCPILSTNVFKVEELNR